MRLSMRILLSGLIPALLWASPASAQMTLPGTFEVSDTGAAVYTIPIEVPPGTAGMQPSLSLQYNSRGGNGLLGMGWSLAGLPAVARCLRTIAQDGAPGGITYNWSDKFCLEGERLIALNTTVTYGAPGSEFRTERDGFSRIVSNGYAGNGPGWFQVWTKSGHVMQFGSAGDSQILAQGSTTARVWALHQVADTKGNYFTVSYNVDGGNGQYQPSEIDYTGNAAAATEPTVSVRFVYATRPDVVQLYQAGSLIRTTVRLTDIQAYVGQNLAWTYHLAYQQSPLTNRSLLASVTRCAADGTCLPATVFAWPAANANGMFQASWSPQPGSDWASWPSARPVGGQFLNKNGFTDILVTASNLGGLGLLFSNGTGFSAGWSPQSGTDWSSLPSATPIVGDFNGDGLADLAVRADNLPGFGMYLSVPSTGAMQPVWSGTGPFGWESSPGARVVTGDFNGDGLTDIAVGANNLGGLGVYFSNGGVAGFGPAFSPQPGSDWSSLSTAQMIGGDFNGDGLSDIAVIAPNMGAIGVYLSNGNGTFGATVSSQTGTDWGSWPSARPIAGDFNGDGLTDIAVIANNLGGIGVYLSNGNGTFLPAWSPQPGTDWGSWPSAQPIAGDFNGDGLTDIAVIANNLGGIGVYLSNGDGTFRPVWAPQPGADWGSWPSARPIAGDFNGDGLTDIAISADNLGGIGFYLASSPVPDLLTSVTDGIGATTTIGYQPLTNGAPLYSNDSDGVFPVVDSDSALRVVARVDTNDGAGGVYTSTYTYVGAKLHLQGRGFLGFREVTATDARTHIATTTTYQQSFPYTSLVVNRIKKLNGQILNDTTNTYACVNETAGNGSCANQAPGTRYFVSLSQSIEQSYELNGTALPTVTTSNQYDAYGNATQVTVATGDGYSKTTANTYTNDTTHWLLGRLTAASVTSTTP
jgi:hypothetical protein